ncbi:YkvI family membrane protein [Acidaminobacterium chupaoyuni]
MKKNNKSSIGAVIGFCGACIAFYIGAGFATMQEVMQYEVSYGSLFMVVIAVAALIYVYTNLSFATNGNRLQLARGGDIYLHYCGKYIGTFYDFFSAFFCYMCFIVMCGGANSTATQQWGLPNGVGAVVLTAAVIVTAVFGLDGILNALSKLGPIIIVIILVVSSITAISGFSHFGQNIKDIDSGVYQLTQVGGNNPIASGASYGGFVILWFASFLSEIGAKNKLKEVNSGMLLSTLFIFGAAALCCIALIAHIPQTADSDIPALILAGAIHPMLAQILAIIIFCGIYTTAVPLLWTGVGRVAKEGTKRYKLFTIVGGIAGCIVACFLPYKGLVNILYGINGYLGFALVAFMVVYDIRTRMGAKNAAKQ